MVTGRKAPPVGCFGRDQGDRIQLSTLVTSMRLLKEWEEKSIQTVKEQGKEGLKDLMIGDGECLALPQGLTSVGYTGRWQRGDRVIDVAKTLKPGTVIANFKFSDGVWQYPHGPGVKVHGYHAALFMGADSYSTQTGKPTRIFMFDQWRNPPPKWPSPRPVYVRPEAIAKLKQPCDKAEDFYVVLVPKHETNSDRNARPILFGRPCGRVSLSSCLPRQGCARYSPYRRNDDVR